MDKEQQTVIDGANELLCIIGKFFLGNPRYQCHTITIIGYAIEAILQTGAKDMEQFDRLSKKLRDFLAIAHDDVKKFQRPDLN